MPKIFEQTPVLTDEEVTKWMFEKGKSGFMVDFTREAQRDASDRNRDKQWMEYLEKYVFYVDTRGYIALKPNATKNYQTLQKLAEECDEQTG